MLKFTLSNETVKSDELRFIAMEADTLPEPGGIVTRLWDEGRSL
jgi:hypothetical protein